MAKRVKIVYPRYKDSFAEIRNDPAVKRDIADRARRIAGAAGEGFDYGVDDWPNEKTKRGKGGKRPHGYVVTAEQAKIAEDAGAAARELGTVLFAVDHHRGSEENQAGWEHHEPDLVDPEIGKMDTLPWFRRTIHDAGLDDVVVAVVADSPTLGRFWTTPLGFLFIDGGHGPEPAHRDYETWVPHVRIGGVIAIHDVFPDPADGGRPPYEIYLRALESGAFAEVSATGSLRVLRRSGP